MFKHTTALFCILAFASFATANESTNNTPGKRVVTVDTDTIVGEIYRFWTVSVTTSQHQFLDKNAGAQLKLRKPYTKSINCVRMLGGRKDGHNQWFKGVDARGKVKTDFRDLVRYLKALVNHGYTPRLVLDNVPTAMSSSKPMNKFGNTSPPDNFDHWRQYITQLMQALVKAFGKDTVKSWRIRVGTEPDLDPGHWSGTREQYLKHYDVTVDAVSKIIEDADIGPGNILNPQESWRKPWGLDIIDHCAEGTNHMTGRKGSRITHFSISYYGAINKEIELDKAIETTRARLAKYPQLTNVKLDIQEFGVLKDGNRRRLWGNEVTEWGASWYAAISEIAYNKNIAEIYEWSKTTAGIPHPRLHVVGMLERMAGGDRLKVDASGKVAGHVGAIAAENDGKLYVLVYNHHPRRSPKISNEVAIAIKGEKAAASRRWTLNEWTIDKDHGVWVYEMYRDCERAGLKPLPKSPIYGGHPAKRYGDEWHKLNYKHKAKYNKLAKLAQTKTSTKVLLSGGVLKLHDKLPGHSVKLLELTPIK